MEPLNRPKTQGISLLSNGLQPGRQLHAMPRPLSRDRRMRPSAACPGDAMRNADNICHGCKLTKKRRTSGDRRASTICERNQQQIFWPINISILIEGVRRGQVWTNSYDTKREHANTGDALPERNLNCEQLFRWPKKDDDVAQRILRDVCIVNGMHVEALGVRIVLIHLPVRFYWAVISSACVDSVIVGMLAHLHWKMMTKKRQHSR